jgi:hypothetical protein
MRLLVPLSVPQSLLLTDIQNFEKQKNGDSVVEQLGGDTNGEDFAGPTVFCVT